MFENYPKSRILQLCERSEHCLFVEFLCQKSILKPKHFSEQKLSKTILGIFKHCAMVKRRICKLRFNSGRWGWMTCAAGSFFPSSSTVSLNNFWSLSISHEELASLCSSDARYDRTPTAATAKSWFPNVFLSFGLLDVLS